MSIVAFVGSAFAIVRYALIQNRALTERFTGFLEAAIRRQEQTNAEFRFSIDLLSENVRESVLLLARVAERIDPKGGHY